MPTEDFNFLMFLIEKTFIGKKKKKKVAMLLKHWSEVIKVL